MPSDPPKKKINDKRRVTLRDIAQELRISHSTVSRALRSSLSISEEVKSRVKQKADEMGYTPDPLLSALSHYRLTSKTQPTQSALAWINPWKDPKRMHEIGEFKLYWEGARETAQKMGFTLEEFSTSQLPLKRLERIFKARNILGVLIAPAHDLSLDGATTDLTDFSWKDFSVVRFGRTKAFPPTHFVTSAQASNTSKTVTTLYEKGYRRIAYAGLLRPMRVFGSGYHMAQQHIPKTLRIPPLYFKEKVSIYDQIDRFASWIKKHKPEAIITDIAEHLQIVQDIGYRVPEDIAFATTSIHDTPINAGIDQRPKEIGRTAIRTLVGLINEQNFGIPENRTEILIEGSWVNGSMLPNKK